MLHELIQIWFQWVHDWEYVGVFILMALESTVVPIPSEIIMPPAAYWAAQGKMNFWGVVAAGTFGSYFGSAISYWVSQKVGVPVIARYGKYVLLGEENIQMAAKWANDFGPFGVFLARLLPVVRHVISIPCGFLLMNFRMFSLATFVGAGVWCYILAVFGQKVLGENPQLLDSPDQMIATMKANLFWFVIAIVGFLALYVFVTWIKKRGKPPIPPHMKT